MNDCARYSRQVHWRRLLTIGAIEKGSRLCLTHLELTRQSTYRPSILTRFKVDISLEIGHLVFRLLGFSGRSTYQRGLQPAKMQKNKKDQISAQNRNIQLVVQNL